MFLTRLICECQVTAAVEGTTTLLLNDWTVTVAHLVEGSLVTLLASDVTRWHPVGAVPWLEALDAVHHVDVLQREGARLVQEEVNDDTSDGVGGEEDKAVSVGDAVVGQRGEETNEDCTEDISKKSSQLWLQGGETHSFQANYQRWQETPAWHGCEEGTSLQ